MFFLISPPRAASEVNLNLSMRRAGEDHPFWSQSFVCRQSEVRDGLSLLLPIEGLSLKKGESYVLTYAIPETETSRGWRLRYTQVKNEPSSIRWSSKVLQSSAPCLLWMETARPRYPWGNILACMLLLAFFSLCARADTSFAGPALLVMATVCILLAAYKWQVYLVKYPINFWPDGYPALSRELYAFFSGQIPFKECLAYFDHDRCGQAFFVPVVMAAFQTLGLSVKGSYLAANALFFTGTVVLLLQLLRLYGITSDRQIIIMGLVFFGNPSFIGSTGALQTDLGGVATTMLYAYALLRAFATKDSRARIVWYLICGFSGFLASITRVALLPLLFITGCLFLWSLFCERQRTLRERSEYLLPVITGVMLLGLCWSSLGLFDSYQKARDTTLQFVQFFSWGGFVITTAHAMQLGLLAVVLLWRRLFRDRGFAAVTGSAFALLALMAYGHIAVWLRYWSPSAALGAILVIWALKKWPDWDRISLSVAGICALFNVVTIAGK